MRIAIGASIGLHLVAIAALPILPPPSGRMAPETPVPVESVTEEQFLAMMEPEQPPRPSPEPEAVEPPDPPAAPEPPEPAPPETTETAPPDAQPVEPETAADPIMPEPDPVEREITAPAPQPVPEPETAAPEVDETASAPPFPADAPMPEPAQTIAAQAAPMAAPPPNPPPAKPPANILATRDKPAPAETRPDTPDPRETAHAAEPPTHSAQSKETAAPPEQTAGLPDPRRSGSFDTTQFLANLKRVRDDSYLRQENPELWEIIQAVRRQIRRCWRVHDPDLADAALAVDMRVAFDPTGQIRKAEIQNVARTVQDDAYRRVAQGARQALDACSPFQLPGDKYEIWKRFTMRFVPNG